MKAMKAIGLRKNDNGTTQKRSPNEANVNLTGQGMGGRVSEGHAMENVRHEKVAIEAGKAATGGLVTAMDDGRHRVDRFWMLWISITMECWSPMKSIRRS